MTNHLQVLIWHLRMLGWKKDLDQCASVAAEGNATAVDYFMGRIGANQKLGHMLITFQSVRSLSYDPDANLGSLNGKAWQRRWMGGCALTWDGPDGHSKWISYAYTWFAGLDWWN